jgi:hypothetical protein
MKECEWTWQKVKEGECQKWIKWTKVKESELTVKKNKDKGDKSEWKLKEMNEKSERKRKEVNEKGERKWKKVKAVATFYNFFHMQSKRVNLHTSLCVPV